MSDAARSIKKLIECLVSAVLMIMVVLILAPPPKEK